MERHLRFKHNVAVQRIRRLIVSGLQTPKHICFGAGSWRNIGRLAAETQGLGSVLVVTRNQLQADTSFRDSIQAMLSQQRSVSIEPASSHGEPTADSVDQIAGRARARGISLIIAIGGGSVLDTGKAVAAMATNNGSVEEYLEGPQGARTLSADPLPIIAVPTTAGTGSEMTRNAVVLSRRQGCKRSLRDDRLYPKVAVIDPALCQGAPRSVTVASGLDAITQLIESAITIKRNPKATALAMESLDGLAETLQRCVDVPDDVHARALMSASASISGACLANSGLGLAHGVAAALGSKYGISHGLACGILLPHALRWNLRACPEDIGRALAALFGMDPADQTEPADLVKRLGNWVVSLGVPPDLWHLNLTTFDLDELSELSMGSSMSGNPLPMRRTDVRQFLITVAI